MKKLAIALLLAAPMMMVSCTEDEQGITLDETAKNVNYGDTFTLKASEKGCTWGSESEFIATVDKDGKVTGVHVGTTVITATKDGETAKCKVTVLPTDNSFTLPVLEWNKSMDAVKALVSNAFTLDNDLTDASTLGYTTNNSTYADGMPWYIYMFGTSGLESSSITLPMEADDDFYAFLEQYYEDITPETSDDIIFADAYNLTNASEGLTYKPISNFTMVQATWMPVQHLRSSYDIVSALEATAARHEAVVARK